MNTATLENSPRTPEPPAVGVPPLATGSAVFDRACSPQCGDIFRLGPETVAVKEVDDLLVYIERDHGEGGGLSYTTKNMARWPEAVRNALDRGAQFLPNNRDEPRR